MHIKTWLDKNHISNTEFSKMIGASVGYVSNIKHGKWLPSMKFRKKISEVTKGEVSVIGDYYLVHRAWIVLTKDGRIKSLWESKIAAVAAMELEEKLLSVFVNSINPELLIESS